MFHNRASVLVVWLLAAYFIVSAFLIFPRAGDLIHNLAESKQDLGYFVTAGRMLFNGNADDLYGIRGSPDLTNEERATVGRYFNPPAFAVFFWPLNGLSSSLAKTLVSAASVASYLLLVGMVLRFTAQRWNTTRTFHVIVILVALTFWPLYWSLMLGQPTAILALLSWAGLTASLTGRYRIGVFLTSLVVLKPTLLIPLLLVIGRLRGAIAVKVLALSGAIFLVPFLVPGGPSLPHYIDVLTHASKQGATYSGDVYSNGAYYMPSWAGFWSRFLAADPPLALVLICSALTIFLAGKVLLRGDPLSAWFACTLAVLLTATHVNVQDWLVLLAPSIMLAASKPSWALWVGLIALHLAVNLSVAQMALPVEGMSWGFYATAPLGVLILAHLAFPRFRNRSPEVRVAASIK